MLIMVIALFDYIAAAAANVRRRPREEAARERTRRKSRDYFTCVASLEGHSLMHNMPPQYLQGTGPIACSDPVLGID